MSSATADYLQRRRRKIGLSHCQVSYPSVCDRHDDKDKHENREKILISIPVLCDDFSLVSLNSLTKLKMGIGEFCRFYHLAVRFQMWSGCRRRRRCRRDYSEKYVSGVGGGIGLLPP
jgi:hypothetical protein